MTTFLKWISALSLCLTLISWGGTGHRIVSSNASQSFNQEMQQFISWSSYLTDHASDADYRKSSDASEKPKHYIDIDNYPEFINAGYIPRTLGEAITVHGRNNVYDWGILPWATKAAFDSLKVNLERNNWDKAKQFAADLGHYVADGHMPLHITQNFDGELTNNDGIHSRYESTMVNAHAAELTYGGKPISQITDVNQYILNYLYTNNKYVDSIITADNYAKSINPNYYSYEYRNALWAKTSTYTVMLLRNASHSLAELIYTAWKDAGSPSLTGISLAENNTNLYMVTVNPNPAQLKASIKFNLKSPETLSITLHDITGNLISTVANGRFTEGEHCISWIRHNEKRGLYFVAITGSTSRVTQKLIIN